jgi:excisionase family DNA binding protein
VAKPTNTKPRAARQPAPEPTASVISVDAPISVTINRSCELTGLPRSTIYDLISEGRLRASKIGRRTLIEYASLRALIEQGVKDREQQIADSVKKGRAILAAEKKAARS